MHICTEHPTIAMRMGFINSKTTALEEKRVESFMPYHIYSAKDLLFHLILERSHGLEVSKSSSITHKIFPHTQYPWLNSVQ
jgi:hypothetical protein